MCGCLKMYIDCGSTGSTQPSSASSPRSAVAVACCSNGVPCSRCSPAPTPAHSTVVGTLLTLVAGDGEMRSRSGDESGGDRRQGQPESAVSWRGGSAFRGFVGPMGNSWEFIVAKDEQVLG